MKTTPKFEVVCYYPENFEELEVKLGQLQNEVVTRYITTLQVAPETKQRIIQDILKHRE